MKRFFTLTLMLFCFILHGFAFNYTDENGVTWTCSATYDESFARLTGASNYGAEVVVPEKVYDGETAYAVNSLYDTFTNSEVITKVTLPKNSIEIYGAFCNCHNLTEVINSQYITTCYGSAFESTSLTSIDLSNCEYVAGFDYCKKLKTAILKVCETIDTRAFADCTNLVSLGETASVISIGGSAFEGCESLALIDLSNCSSWPYASIFGNCKNLKEIKLPSTLTEIPSALFSGCTGLTSFDFTNITKIGDSAFEGTGLKEIILPATITSIGNNAFNGIDYVTINATKVPTLGGSLGQNTVVLVPEEALNAYKTADVWKDFAGQILAIGAKLDYDVKTTALDNAPGLLQQLDRNNLNNIVSLKVSGTINGYDIMLFRNKMDNLHHLDLSDADIVANPYEYYEGNCTQDSILGNYAFSELDKLITVKCPKSVKQIYGAFKNCNNLRSVVLPEQLEYIGKEEDWGSGNGPFSNCVNLKNIIFNGCKEIGNNTFYGCSAIQQINIPEGVTRIGENAFYGCI